jgi:GAF domain-containing protein
MALSTPNRISEVRQEVDRLNSAAGSADQLMKGITFLLNQQMLKYNWVGFDILEQGTDLTILVRGDFQGAINAHTGITVNKGLDGVGGQSGKTVVVDDVNSDPRYLACSLETKSEIVVPVFARGKVAGELDIDSHFPAAFGSEDRELIEYCAQVVGKQLEKE